MKTFLSKEKLGEFVTGEPVLSARDPRVKTGDTGITEEWPEWQTWQ